MHPRFEQFIKEKKYLHNVSPSTETWYRNSLKWLPGPTPDDAALKELVMRMRDRGLKATSCNCHIRAINSFLHWDHAGVDHRCGAGCPHLRVQRLKEESYVPETYTSKQVQSILRWKPRGFFQRRLYALALTLLDTGVRLDEALSLCVRDCNLDDLLLTVTGKGRKQRVIPFSLELRRVLAKFILDFCPRAHQFVFGTALGRKLSQRNVLRDIKALCVRLGFDAPKRTCHAARHTFATEYLRRGGSLFHLQKVLGHTTLEMVRKYASLVTADLSAVHERVSLLSN